MILDRFTGAGRRRRAHAEGLYARLVRRARDPWFYEACEVPDTVDGRFDMIVIHAHLLFRRLRETGQEGEALAQVVFNVMFKDMDRSLREMGVGDLSVGKHVKGMARAFYGRSVVYEKALAAGRAQLVETLRQNVYRLSEPSDDAVDRLADYMESTAQALNALPLETLLSEEGTFPPRAEGRPD